MFTLRNDRVKVTIDARSDLVELANRETGHGYANGRALWRLYFQRGDGPGLGIDIRPEDAAEYC
jgi:hypothetical protein